VFEAGRDVLQARRQAGINVVRNRLNWPSSVDRVEECLGELRETVPRRIVARRAAAARAYRRDTALREMAIERALARLPKRTLV
jgi:hypothetical protein